MQLLSWQQRLSALASQPGQLAAALLAAVRIYQAATSSSGVTSSQARQQPQGSAAWPADGGGAAPPEVQRQLLTILCAYVDQGLAALQQAPSHVAAGEPASTAPSAAQHSAAQHSAAQLADTAIGCCLLLRRPDALWSDLFPRFQSAAQHGAAQLGGDGGTGGGSRGGDGGGTGGPEAAFLHQLLPFILSDQLPSVAPEVRCVGEGCL